MITYHQTDGDNSKKTIWMIIDHPNQFFTALGIAENIPNRNNYHINLIISQHPYWKDFPIKKETRVFNTVYIFNKRPDFLKNILKGGFLIFYNYLKIKDLPILPQDLLLCFAGSVYIENMILSRFDTNPCAFISTTGKSINSIQPSNKKVRYKNIRVAAYNIFNKILNLHEVSSEFFLLKYPFSYHYKKGARKVYDQLYQCQNIIKPSLRDYELYFPYLLLRQKNQEKTIKKKYVIFWGTSEIFPQKLVKQIFNYIMAHFGNYEIHFKEHPRTPKEVSKFYWPYTKNFKHISKDIFAEYWLFQHAANYAASLALISTAAKTACNYGIPSYVFIDFILKHSNIFSPDEQKQLYMDYGTMPDESFIKNLDEPPKAYTYVTYVTKDQIQQSLNQLFQNL